MKAEKIKRELISPLTIYGGKSRMVHYLLPLLYAADPVCYVEVCMGGAQLTFALPKHKKEVMNDINDNIVAFFRVLKTNPHALAKRVSGTPFSHSEFNKAREIFFSKKKYSDLDRAWAAWAGCTMGFAHDPKSFGFDHVGKQERTLFSKRENFKKLADVYAGRLETVTIENDDLLKIIKRYDKKDTLFFIDPPYFNADMGFYSGFTEEKFRQTLSALKNIKGKFVLTTYPSDVLTEFTKKCRWHQRSIILALTATKNVGVSARKKTEVITWNFDESSGALNGLNGTPHPAFLIARMLELILTHR